MISSPAKNAFLLFGQMGKHTFHVRGLRFSPHHRDSAAVLLSGVRVAERSEIFPYKQSEHPVAHECEYVASALFWITIQSEKPIVLFIDHLSSSPLERRASA